MSYSPTLLGQFVYTAGDIGGPFYNDPLGSTPQTISIPISQDVPAGSVLFVGYVRQIGAGGQFGIPQIGSQAFALTVGQSTGNPLVTNTDYASGTAVTISVLNLIYAVVEVYLLNGFEDGFQVGGTAPTGLGLYYNLTGLQADVNGNMPGDPIGHTESDMTSVTLVAAGTKVYGTLPSPQDTRYKDTYRFIRYEDSDQSHNWNLVSSNTTLDGTQTSSLGFGGLTLRIYPTNLGGGKNIMRRHPLFGEAWFVGNAFPGAPTTNRELVASKDPSAPRTHAEWSIPSGSPGVSGFSFGFRKSGQQDVFYTSGGICKFATGRKNTIDFGTAMTLSSANWGLVSHAFDEKSGLFHVMLYKTTDNKWYYMKCPMNPATGLPDPTGITPAFVIAASQNYAELRLERDGTLTFSYIQSGTAGLIRNRKGGNGAWS